MTTYFICMDMVVLFETRETQNPCQMEERIILIKIIPISYDMKKYITFMFLMT